MTRFLTPNRPPLRREALALLAAPLPAAAADALTLNRVRSLLAEMGFKPIRPSEDQLTLESETFDGALVSKAMLRKSIDQLIEMIDRNEELWNTDNWPVKPK